MGSTSGCRLRNSTSGGVADSSLWKLTYHFGELNADGSTVDATKNTGNIAMQTVSFAGLTKRFVQTYRYDSLYRITEARETNGPATNASQNWKETFGYDRYGNRTAFSKFSGMTELALDNKTFPSIDPATNRFNPNQGYGYDKNGNLISDAEGRSFVFNGENKQAKIIKDGKLVGEYDYNGEGQRVRKRTFDADGFLKETTVFVYSAGKLVAEYTTAAPPENPTTRYTATDMLGSPRVITDSEGNVISRRDFKPFGEEITNNTGERTTSAKYGAADNLRQKFTTYQRDEETGLDFAEARMYENRHGRFTAVDPLLASGKSANPQTFNRFVYVGNSPLVITDPTGLIGDYYKRNGEWIGSDGKNDGKFYFADIATPEQIKRGEKTGVKNADVYVTNVEAVTLDRLIAASTAALESSSDNSISERNPIVGALLDGFPANPYEQAFNGLVTGPPNDAVYTINFFTTIAAVRSDPAFRYTGVVRNPLYIEPFGCSGSINCNWQTGSMMATTIGPGMAASVFRTGGPAISGATQVRPNGSIQTLVGGGELGLSSRTLVIRENHLKDISLMFRSKNGTRNLFRLDYWKHVLPHRHIYELPSSPTRLNNNWRKTFESLGATKRTVFPWQD